MLPSAAARALAMLSSAKVALIRHSTPSPPSNSLIATRPSAARRAGTAAAQRALIPRGAISEFRLSAAGRGAQRALLACLPDRRRQPAARAARRAERQPGHSRPARRLRLLHDERLSRHPELRELARAAALP